MKLVIAEKPGVGIEIAKALNVVGKKNGYIQNNEWTITWCVGHLCTLKEPHDYDEKYKDWKLEDLPIIPKKYELKVVPDTEDQYKVVSRLLQNNRFEFVVNATDAAREGELIFDNVYRLSGSKLPIKRLWTSSALTEEAIQREFKNLKPASDFDGLRIAARVRAACDWLIGMNATRAVTLNVGIWKQVFSIGRVQTPTLSFIVQRELEIIDFKSQEFWTINGVFSSDKMSYNGTYKFLDRTGKISSRIFDKEKANSLFLNLKKQKNAHIIDIEKENKKSNPPGLLDLTNLQKEANKIYGFSAEDTLNIAQKLYETHKVLSYPRTDYKCLPNEMKKEVKKILGTLKNTGDQVRWFETAERNLNNKCDHIFDDSRVGDHHALLPMAKIPENLHENEQKIYDIVLKRLLASLNEEHLYETTQIITETSNEKFYSNGVVIINYSFLVSNQKRFSI